MDFRKYKLKKIKQQIMKAIYASTVYAIWMSRNLTVWEGMVKTPKSIA